MLLACGLFLIVACVPSAKAEAAIQFVGSTTASGVNTAYNMSLSSLTGGIGSAPAQNDIIIVTNTFNDIADGNPGVASVGYTEVADLYVNDTRDVNTSVSYIFATSTPVTSVTCNGSANTASSSVCTAMVFRGVNTSNPMDVTATTTAAVMNTEDIDCPVITPVTTGAYVVCAGGAVGASVSAAFATISGYTHQYKQADAGGAAASVMAYKAWTSGAENPAAFVLNMGTAAQNSWAAVTMALRPAPLAISGTLFSDEGITAITSSKTIKLAVGTSSTPTVYSTTSNASGVWSFGINGALIPSAPLLVWVDGDATTRASLFTKASTTGGDMTGLSLYQNRVIVSHEATTSTSTTVANLSFYDNSNDTDIQYSATSSTGEFTIFGSQELHVWTGKVMELMGSSTLTGDVHIATSSRLVGGATTTIQGHFTNHGTFTENGASMWVLNEVQTAHDWNGLVYGNGVFVAVVDDCAVFCAMTSSDGVNWVSRHAITEEWEGVTYGNGLFVAVAETGTGDRVMTSPDGIVWTARNAAVDNDWQSVTYGLGSGTTTPLFVAVSDTGTGNRVMTSPDGINWTSRTSATDNSWHSVTYGNGKFVAVAYTGTGNRVMTSTNGTAWSTQTSAADMFWTSVTYGNGLFVAVGASTGVSNNIMTSPDGISWTSRTSLQGTEFFTVTYGNGVFVATADVCSGGECIMTSIDGITWKSLMAPKIDIWDAVAYGNGKFVAVAYNSAEVNTVMVSDAKLFMSSTSAQTLQGTMTGTSTLTNVTFTGAGTKTFAHNASTTNFTINPGATVVVPNQLGLNGTFSNSGTFTHNGGTIFMSDSAVASGTLAGTSAFNNVTITGTGTARFRDSASTTNVTINTGSTLVVPERFTIAGNLVNNGVYDTSIGKRWSFGAGTTDVWWRGVTYGNGRFVAVGDHDINPQRAMVSTDGKNWSANNAIDFNWSDVAYGEGLFVAVSYSADIMTSSDGINWTIQTAPSGMTANAVTYGKDRFVAVGWDSGGFNTWMSLDGITWNDYNPPNTEDWRDVIYGNGLFVAVGYSGYTMNSVDGITWSTASLDWACSLCSPSVTYGNGLFVGISNYQPGSQEMIATSTDGLAWSSGQDTSSLFDYEWNYIDDWTSITFGDGLFVAVGQSIATSAPTILTSPDAEHWTSHTAPTINSYLTDITYGNGKFVAVADYAPISGSWAMSSQSLVTFSSTTAQSISGTLTGTSSLSDVVFTGASTKTFSNNASTTNFTINTGATVVAPAYLSVVGDYTNSGTFTAGTGTTTFAKAETSPATTTISGTTSGTSAFSHVVLQGYGTTTFSGNNASTTNLFITNASTTLLAPSLLTVAGDYSNTGRFVASTSGTTTFNGTSQQTLSGTLTGTSAFSNLRITNTSGAGDSSQSILFSAAASTTGTLTMLASTSARFLASASSTFQNIDLQGSAGSYVWLRSSSAGTRYSFYVPGTQSITYTDVKDNSACPASIIATDGTNVDSGNNACWTFTVGASGLTISGTLYSDEGITTINTGKTIALAIGTSTPSVHTTTSNGSGVWTATIPEGHTIGTSTPILVWVDNDGTTRAALLTKAASSTNISGLSLYKDRVIVSHEGTGTSTTLADMAFYDNDNDSDIQFNTSTTSGILTVNAGNELHVLTGKTFAPNALVDARGNFKVATSSTANMASSSLMVGGDYINHGTAPMAQMEWTARAAAEANGWQSVTYGNGLFVAVATYGTNQVMTSPDGITWTARAAAEANTWRSVTYGLGSGTTTPLFVAVSYNGTNRVMTSPDGITWTARSAAEANLWESVTYGLPAGQAGNGLFVAVAGNGTNRVMTSPDGITWTARTAAEANTWRSVTYGNGLFVAVSNTGTNQVMTSPDGITWTSRTSAANNSWYSVTYGNGLFVAVSQDGVNNRVMTSPDGITWTSRTSAADNQWYSVTYGNGLFVAVGYESVMTSPDGIAWTPHAAAEANFWQSVTYSNGLFVVVANSGTNRVMTSPGGHLTLNSTTTSQTIMGTLTGVSPLGDTFFTGAATKTFQNNASTSAFEMAASSGAVTAPNSLSIGANYTNRSTFTHNSGTVYLSGATSTATGTMTGTSAFNNLIVAGTGTKTFTTSASTTNLTIAPGVVVLAPARLSVKGDYTNSGTAQNPGGREWTARAAAAANSWFSVTYGNGLFVAVSSDGTNQVMTSPDGITWTPRAAAEANNWYSVTYRNGLFVAVAGSGTNRVMTSPDGITWTSRSASEANSWTSVTYGDGLFVAVARTGTGNRVMTSPDGITWTSRTSAADNSWQSITYGNGLFVAVSSDGTNRVMTSPDGITWTARAATEANGWWFVTYGNSLFVAVSGDGTNRVMTSPDGITWTARTAAEANGWKSVTYANGLFVAVSSDGTNRVMTSPDGITWTARTAAAANQWRSITYGNGLFVAVSVDGTNRVMTSAVGTTTFNGTGAQALSGTMTGGSTFGNVEFTGAGLKSFATTTTNASTSNFMVDAGATVVAPEQLSVSGNYTNNGTSSNPGGKVWVSRTSAADSNWYGVTYGNGLFVAVASNAVMTSPDGITWTSQTPASSNSWNSVTYGNGLFVAVASSGSGNRVMTSPDGITWTTRTSAADNSWYSVTYGNSLFVAVACGVNNTSCNSTAGDRVMTSPDGITWTSRTDAADLHWKSVTYGNGTFVAVAQSGTGNRVMTSPDGITWTSRTSAADNYWQSVTYGNGLFVAVATFGGIMTSSDGVTWTSRTSPSSNSWYGVTYGNGLFVAVSTGVGAGDRVMTSTDGITWTSRVNAADNSWSSVTYGNGLFVAVAWSGTGNRVMTSAIGTTTFNGGSSQTATGAMTGASAFGNVAFTNTAGTTTLANNASTSNFVVSTGATAVAPSLLTVSGDYQNNGRFVAGIGTTTFTGNTPQTATGTMTGTSAFNNLVIANSVASTTFATPMTTSGKFTATTPGTIIILSSTGTTTLATAEITGSTTQSITLRSTTPGTQAALDIDGTYTLSYIDVKDSNACDSAIALSGTGLTDSGNNTCWTFPTAAILISGTLYSDEGITTINTGKTIALAIGTSTPSIHTTTSNGSGVWTATIPEGHTIGTSTPILVWVDNDGTTRAALLTKAASSTNISGLSLYKDRVIVSHEGTGTSTTLADMAFYDNSNDTDIQYSATSSTGELSVFNIQELHVFIGKTLTLTGSSTVTGDVHIATSSQLTAGATTTVTGNFAIDEQATVLNSPYFAVSGNYTNSGTSSNPGGKTWTSRTSAADNGWNSVTYGNGTFVAVGVSGTNNRVMTSPDGITWTIRTSAADNMWMSVTYGNGLFVAVAQTGTNNRVMTSPDGITWTSRTSATDNIWNSVTYGNGLFVAVAYSGTGDRVMTSPDGVTWTSRTSIVDNDWYSVTYGNSTFVAVAGSGTGNRVMTSPDGITWTSRTSATDNIWNSVTYGNGLFVAVADSGTGNRVMTSPDGITWTSRTSAADNSWNSVTYGNGLFVAVAYDGISDSAMTSVDGINWTLRTSAVGNQWLSVTYGNGLFVAISNSGTGNRVMTSSIGTTTFNGTSAQALSGTLTGASAFGNVEFTGASTKTFSNNASTSGFTINSGATVVPPAHLSIYGNYLNNGTYTGGTGTTTFYAEHTQTASGTMTGTSAFNNVAISGSGLKTLVTNASTTNLIIASGAELLTPQKLSVSGQYTNNGTAQNPGGKVWVSRTSAVENAWYGVAYGNGLFVAASSDGVGANKVMTSPDGITWTSSTGINNTWTAMTHGNGLFVAVGLFGTVMTSPDGVTWTSQTAASGNHWRSVTYGNGLFVAVSSDGTGNRVMTSPDGVTWTSRTSAADHYWRSVTYGNGLFVAVACGVNSTSCNTTAGDRVMTSTDGITWNLRTDAADNSWYSVTYGNGLFVAVAYTGTRNRVMTSFDGITWTSRVSVVDNFWYSVTYGNGLFVAVSSNGTGNRVMTSPDGITWTSRTSAADNSWQSITYGNGTFVAVSSSGSGNRVMTSAIGTTTFNGASAQTLGGTMTGASAFGNVEFTGAGAKSFATTTTNASTSNFMVDSGATVVAPEQLSVSGNYTNNGTSSNPGGKVWTARTAAEANTWFSVTYGNGLFVAVAYAGANQVMTSPDGITWTPRNETASNLWRSVTYGNGLFVAVSTDGANRVMTSPDGITWTPRTAAAANSWYSVTYGNGLFVAVSFDGTNRVMTSPDGITWTSRTSAADNYWQSITYGNGLFVAVSLAIFGTINDRVMTSPDGITWTPQTAAENNHWNSVTYGNGLFVAVAYSGTNRVMTSPDGITWTPRTAAEANTWFSVTYGNGTFVAVSTNGTNRVMTSPDGITWTPRTAAEANGWRSVVYGNSTFVTVTDAGTNRVMTSAIGTTTFTGGSSQTATGAMTGASAFGNVAFTNTVGTTTLANNASTSNFVVNPGATVVAPEHLSLSGDYQNNGRFVAGSGTVILDGSTPQTLSGTLTATSAFNGLTIRNASQDGTTTQSIRFTTSASTTGTFTMLPATSAQFQGNSTSTFQNINWNGGTSTTRIYLRSTASSTPWNLVVPGTQESVAYVSVRDSHACSGNPDISAAAGTSVDVGGNTCWTFDAAIAAILASGADQLFGYGQATTSISAITITDTAGTITAANDIRIRIATTSVNMRWDTTDTTATFGGTASGKVSSTVTYEDNGATLVIDVSNNFSADDTLTIDGLSYAQFLTLTTPVVGLNMYLAGAGDTVSDDADEKTLAISGLATLAEHSEGQVEDNISSTHEENISLYAFTLASAGEDATVSEITFRLLGINGIESGDITGMALYYDVNGNKALDGGDVAVGGTPTVTLGGEAGTITFSSAFTASTTRDYILVGSIDNIRVTEGLSVILRPSDITATGVTTGAIVKTGMLAFIQHMKGNGGGSAPGTHGAIGGPPPAGDGETTGGGSGGGSGVDPDSGTPIGNEDGFNAPGSNGNPQGVWVNGGNVYVSDGVYMTTSGNSARHSFGTFGFVVPETNQIIGFEVKLEANGSTAAGNISAGLSWNNGANLTDVKTTGTLGLTDAVYVLGSPSDLWGRSWTVSELGNGAFVLELIGNPSSNTIAVDAIQVKVYHQATGGGGGGGGAI